MVASVELGCAQTSYFNMLPSRLEGFGVDNFLFSESVDMFLLTYAAIKKCLLKLETDKEFL